MDTIEKNIEFCEKKFHCCKKCSDECEEVTKKKSDRCCIYFVNLNLERESKGEYSALGRDVTKPLCGHCFRRWRMK